MSARRWLIPGPIILLLLVALIITLGVPESGENLGPLALLAGQLTAGFLAIRRSSSLEPREQRIWRLYGLAILIAAMGVLAFGVWSIVVGDPPAFGALDVLEVLHPPRIALDYGHRRLLLLRGPG